MAIYQKLTRSNIRKLAPGRKLIENGISFERLPNGDGLYTVNIMVDRVRIHRVIGRESEGVTRTQCETFIETTRTAAREERLALPSGRKVALTFPEATKEYLAKLEEIGGKGIERKKCQLDLHLKPFFREKALSKITSFDLERYKKHRVDEGASFATVNRELAVLSHLFSMAVEWKWLTHRPAKINRYKEDNGRITYLTVEQCADIFEAAKSDVSPHIYLYSLIALSTAMRMSEILSIRRENVDVARRRIFVPKAKAGAREQPMTAELASYLARYMSTLPKGTDWLFPSVASRSGHLATIRKAHRRVVKAAGLDPDAVVRHTFRHTAVTHLVQAGVDLPTVQKISGHKTLSMVARYAHANGAHIDAAMAQLETRIGARKVGPITPELHKGSSTA
jgi:site-specific recombinase XerD